MTQTITYDESTLLSPGEADSGALGVQLRVALGGIVSTATLDNGAAAGTRLRVTYAQTLTAGEVTTADGVVQAHDANSFGDLGDVLEFVDEFEVTPNPPNNTWADVPGVTFSVIEGRTISAGSLDVSARVGNPGQQQQCGSSCTFDAHHEPSDDVEVSYWGATHGNVNGWSVRLGEGSGGDETKLQIRRRGTRPVHISATLDYRIDLS